MAGAALWMARVGAAARVGRRGACAAAIPASLPGAVRAVEEAAPSLPEIVLLGRWTPELPVRDRADVRLLAETVAGTYPTPAGRPDARPVRPRDGVMSTVGLLLERGSVKLRQGGLAESKIVPSDPDAGTETEVALALVPYLLHPGAETALAIGHGAGWTVETLLATDLSRVDVAEIEPAVLDVVEEYRPGPLAVRTDPKARLHLTDGRILLRQAAARGGAYDLVVSQPSHPWVPGAGHLYTRDAYRLARAALRPGGVFAQWLNIFNMTEPLFRTALASWQGVFPHGWVLLYNDEVLLVGFLEPPVVHTIRWKKALDHEAVGVRARAAGITGVEDVLRRLVLDGPGLAKVLGADAVPSTDDDPRLELGLARSMFFADRTYSERNAEKAAIYAALASAYPPDFAAILRDAPLRDAVLAATAMRAVEVGGAAEAWRLTRKAPFDGGALGQRARARARFAEAKAKDKQPAEARQLRADGIALLDAAVRASPDDASLLAERLGASRTTARRVGRWRRRGARRAVPDHGPIRAPRARAHVRRDRPPRSTRSGPWSPRARRARRPDRHAAGPPAAGRRAALAVEARDALRRAGTAVDREALRKRAGSNRDGRAERRSRPR
jgi:spermidine synthase